MKCCGLFSISSAYGNIVFALHELFHIYPLAMWGSHVSQLFSMASNLKNLVLSNGYENVQNVIQMAIIEIALF